jgi:ribosome-binding factor A
MPRQRVARVADEVCQAAAEILRGMKDPRMGFATVVRAEVSSDLRHARIYVSVLGPEADQEATMAALERAKGYVRTELGRRVRLYRTPEIQFVLDRSIAHGDRIARVLGELRAGRPSEAAAGGAAQASAGSGPEAATGKEQ